MSDVLIVNPPSPDGYVYIRDICRWGRKSREGMLWPQTSLAYLAAMVPENMTVRIIDAIAEGMTLEEFLRELRREKPRFYVGYITGTTFSVDARCVQEAKGLGAVTIAIGTHVSAVPRDTLVAVPELDYVIRHEPEFTFREILERTGSGAGLKGCQGIAHRDQDGQIVLEPDRPLVKNLDDLPIPKQHLLPLDKYRMPFLGKRYTWVLTNRGCPYSCTYCFEGLVWGKAVRSRSAASICRELVYLAQHNVRNVLFLADLFTYNRRGVMELCDEIIRQEIKVRWTCNSRVDTIDEEMLLRMKQAGCWLIAFGIESGSQQVLDNVQKDAKVEAARTAIRLCNKHGIKTWGYFIIGLPGENHQTVRQTIDLAKSIPLDIALFHVAMPYAGTEFYFQAVANGWLNTTDWSDFDMNDAAVMGYADFSGEEILQATKQAFREFYLRPRQAWRLLRMVHASGDFGLILSVARKFLKWIFFRKDDRVARKASNSAIQALSSASSSQVGLSEPAIPVMEAPRTRAEDTKPRHRAVQQAARDLAGHDPLEDPA